ncbi:MAG TPA: hypothetical protein VKR52_10485 [Terracidiphilus sp.]|nr:hypothetical protein [Terracidiphilus sp.]
MQAFTAAQVISPAINRTKEFLFRPFRWSTFLKLCAVGVITEGFSGNFNFNNGHHRASAPATGLNPLSLTPLNIAMAVFALLLVIVICAALLYLITRLRFALFHCLIHRTREISPGWRLYREQSWRFFLLNLAVGFVFVLVVAAITIPFAIGIYHFFRTRVPGAQFDVVGFLALVLPLIPLVILFILAGMAIDVILRDLMLPHMALENASAGAAWTAARARIAAEQGGFFVYGLLRILLPIVAYVGIIIVLAIPLIIVFGSWGLIVAGLHSLTTDATRLTAFLLVPLEALFVLAGAALAIFLALIIGGPLSICVRYYALLFYGGRYPMLGNILSPPPPPAPVPATT